MGQTITLRPIYGWGWLNGSGESRDEPLSFNVRLNETTQGNWKGAVTSADHEFFGLVADLSQRHKEWDGVVNVQLQKIGSDVMPVAVGYAEIADLQSLSRDAT